MLPGTTRSRTSFTSCHKGTSHRPDDLPHGIHRLLRLPQSHPVQVTVGNPAPHHVLHVYTRLAQLLGITTSTDPQVIELVGLDEGEGKHRQLLGAGQVREVVGCVLTVLMV